MRISDWSSDVCSSDLPDRNSDTTVSNANFPEWSGPINDRLRIRNFCSPGNYMKMSLRSHAIIHQLQCEGSFSNGLVANDMVVAGSPDAVDCGKAPGACCDGRPMPPADRGTHGDRKSTRLHSSH